VFPSTLKGLYGEFYLRTWFLLRRLAFQSGLHLFYFTISIPTSFRYVPLCCSVVQSEASLSGAIDEGFGDNVTYLRRTCNLVLIESLQELLPRQPETLEREVQMEGLQGLCRLWAKIAETSGKRVSKPDALFLRRLGVQKDARILQRILRSKCAVCRLQYQALRGRPLRRCSDLFGVCDRHRQV